MFSSSNSLVISTVFQLEFVNGFLLNYLGEGRLLLPFSSMNLFCTFSSNAML